MKRLKYLNLACLIFIVTMLRGQDVKISQDINIKSDYAYDLMKVNDNIVFYRDKGGEYFLEIFDLNLNFKRNTQIFLDEKKGNIDCIHSVDSSFVVYYSYKIKDTMFLKAVRYDKFFNKTDTATIIQNEEYFSKNEMRYVLSDDKTKIMFFFIDKDKLNFHIFNASNFTKLSYGLIEFKEDEILEGFEEVSIGNNGHGFFLFETNNNSWFKEKHLMHLLSIIDDRYTFTLINSENNLSLGTLMTYDNLNKNVIIAGLYTEKASNESNGYFSLILPQSSYSSLQFTNLKFSPYDGNINQEVLGNDKKKGKNSLQDFFPKAIIPRRDGGFILVTELQREFSRRMNNGGMSTFDRSVSLRSFVDYYSDDLLIWSINPDNSYLWRKSLFKKQFSQDDDGIYSSFLVLKNPSAIHIIFNDEIKNNSTVSQYVVDPLGNYIRKSVLSTEYKNLRLKFKDGFQISSNSFIVLSERSQRINLVKVDI
jgi:hypothetical protein